MIFYVIMYIHAQIGKVLCWHNLDSMSLSETYTLNVKDVHAHVPVHMFNVHV